MSGESVENAVKEAVENASAAGNETAPFEFHESLMAYSGLYVMAIFCIVLGSFRSVAFVREHKKKHKKIENSVSEKEAKWFPITASTVLFTLYFVFKYTGEGGLTLLKSNLRGLLANYSLDALASLSVLAESEAVKVVVDEALQGNLTANLTGLALVKSYVVQLGKKDLMNLLLVLICFQGCQALAHLLKPLIVKAISWLPISAEREPKNNLFYEFKFHRAKAENMKSSEELWAVAFDTHDLVALLVFLPIGVAHCVYGHWITNDIIGVAFSLFAIEMLHLGSFKGGLYMLAGLFVYDVFWVFCTDVMTTVATNINAPILLQFPQDMLRHGILEGKKHSMLGWQGAYSGGFGLGDIVIPGIFLALLMRFDTGVATKAPKKRRYYFWATIFAYAVGLVLTIFVMHYFKAAQPALLYLVPLCVGAPLLLAVCRGEVAELMAFNEAHLVKQEDNEKPDKKEKKKETKKDSQPEKSSDGDDKSTAGSEKTTPAPAKRGGRKKSEKEEKKEK